MAIVNRELDSSQQVVNLSSTVQVGAPTLAACNGLTNGIAVMPHPGALVGAGVASMGLSGAPNLSLWVNRFVVGSGFTAFCIGASLVAQAFGTSGGQTFSLLAGTAATLPLQTGDVITLCGAGANTGAQAVTVTLAVKALQDIKSQFGAQVS